jgi:hypothetical protein
VVCYRKWSVVEVRDFLNMWWLGELLVRYLDVVRNLVPEKLA